MWEKFGSYGVVIGCLRKCDEFVWLFPNACMTFS